MTLGPWLVWVPLLAAINLLVFIAVRGRWGRIVPALGVAAVIGVVVGDLVGERTGLEIMRIGDMNVLAASVAAQGCTIGLKGWYGSSACRNRS